jgi:hypothetical protein
MSLILGATGGAGEQMANIAQQNQKAWDAQDMAKLESDLATQRAQAMEVFKTNLATTTATQARDAQQGRINAQMNADAEQGVAQKRGVVQQGITDQASWTPEQQAAVDQSLNLDKQAAMKDPKARTQAAIETGDISPTDAMKTSSSMEINQLKMQSLLDRANDRNATMAQIADVKTEAMKYGYELRLQAAQERAANGKIDTATSRMLITSEDANIRASTSQLSMLGNQLANTSQTVAGKPNPQYQTLTQEMDQLRGDIAESKRTKLDLFKSLNIVPSGSAPDATVTPPAAPPAVTPASRPPLGSFLK